MMTMKFSMKKLVNKKYLDNKIDKRVIKTKTILYAFNP